ncbi:MAG: DNA primase [Bacillota bacterium]|nr:DNA primase [Bacillota bacterium]
MSIPDRFIDELTAKCDIVDIISRYVALKKSGGNFFGLCPFHSEKTPSFSVSPDKQIYHCFGCSKGGGVINFIMNIENLDFPESVRFLAKILNMEVPEDGKTGGDSSKKERLYAASTEAARYFHAKLFSDEGKEALSYLERRALSKRTIRNFGLGYAPDAWDGLIKELMEKGFTKNELLDAGLVVKNSKGSIYDRFRNRAMFPIIDLRGNVIGFGGRVLDQSLPKYLNSPDTPIFNKSRNLFAINIAKNVKSRTILLAEGYMDVIALHQAGFTNAVASLGTSLTEDQARLISRYADEAVISYDADEAGRKAAARAINILKKTGLNVKILRIPGAKDPDEFIKSNGADAFLNLLSRSENHIEYRLCDLRAKYNLGLDEDRVSYLKAAAKLLSTVESPVEREIYASRVAEEAKITLSGMLNEIKKEYSLFEKKKKREEKREILSPASAIQPKTREFRYGNVHSAAAEEGIISLCFYDPTLIPDILSRISSAEFSSRLLGKVLDIAAERYKDERPVTLPSVSDSLSEAEISHISKVISKPVKGSDIKKAMSDYISIIKLQSLKGENLDEESLLLAQSKYREIKGFGGNKV